MDEKQLRFKLPDLDFYQYELLLNSLQYYKNSSIEFAIDGDTITDIYVLTTRIQEGKRLV